MRDLTTLDGILAEQGEWIASLDAAIGLTDSLQGQPGAEQAWKDQFAVSEMLDGIVLRLCAYCPRNRAEQIAKAKALFKWIGADDTLTREEAGALIGSMVEGGIDV